jgi:excisionase family DNA binding protein
VTTHDETDSGPDDPDLFDAWVSVDEAAQLLHCTPRTIHRMIDRGQLESLRTDHRSPTGSRSPGRLRWIARTSVEKIIEQSGPAVADDPPADAKYYVSLKRRA